MGICKPLLLTTLTQTCRRGRSRNALISLRSLPDLPALAIEDFLDPVEDLLFVFSAFAVFDAVRRGDDDGFVHDHLLIVPADGHVSVFWIVLVSSRDHYKEV